MVAAGIRANDVDVLLSLDVHRRAAELDRLKPCAATRLRLGIVHRVSGGPGNLVVVIPGGKPVGLSRLGKEEDFGRRVKSMRVCHSPSAGRTYVMGLRLKARNDSGE